MANPWFRVWADMVNDPKWRTIARKSGQKIGDVITVYLHMLTCASNAAERGRTQGFDAEDVATALDLDIEQVEAICAAMQGRVLEGDYLTGWEKRQPIREDEGAAARAKAWRDAQKAAKEQGQTQPNAAERKETLDTDTDTDKSFIPPKRKKTAKLPMPKDFGISERVQSWATEKGYRSLEAHFENFVSAVKRNGYTYADWDEALMEAIRKDWAKLGGAQLSVVGGSDPRFKGAK